MRTRLEEIRAGDLPRHVAIIMDGNGRWAEARGLPRTAGHEAGAAAAERLIRFLSARLPIPYVTLFAFSSENWTRPAAEVAFLMELLGDFIRARIAEFAEAGIRLRVLGDRERLPAALRSDVERALAATVHNQRMHLTIALGYGARREIADAARRLVADVAAGRLHVEAIDEAALAGYLETAEIPDPDLVIRTSGELRLSNFLLWQSAYAELYFTETLWPDFTPAEFLTALGDFESRHRRFGAVEATRS